MPEDYAEISAIREKAVVCILSGIPCRKCKSHSSLGPDSHLDHLIPLYNRAAMYTAMLNGLFEIKMGSFYLWKGEVLYIIV